MSDQEQAQQEPQEDAAQAPEGGQEERPVEERRAKGMQEAQESK